MSTVIDELAQEHVEVLERIAQVGARFADTRVCAAFIDFLEQEVVRHFAKEEEALFPELAQIPQLADGPLRVMNTEHDSFRSLLQAAQRARQDGHNDELSRIANDLAGLLQAHIAKEDGVLFPLALELLTKAQLDRVDRRGTRAPVRPNKVENKHV